MNANATMLRGLIQGAELTRAATAATLHVSIETIHAWLKPDTSKGHNPTPLWAVELLALKTGQPIPTGKPARRASAPSGAKRQEKRATRRILK
jgi:hypothetical protein